MTGRSWFFASQGQQQGPYPEAELREFIANATVTAETLVWTEGMAGWQKSGAIAGLLSAAPSPRAFPASGMPRRTAGATAAQSLSVVFSIWALLGRALLFLIGFLLVIPAPWGGHELLSLVYRAPAAIICVRAANLPARPKPPACHRA